MCLIVHLSTDVQFRQNQNTSHVNETIFPSESLTVISAVGSSSLHNSKDNLKQLVKSML